MSLVGIPLILASVSGATCDFAKIPLASISAGTDGYICKSVGGVSTWTAPSLSNIPGTGTANQVLQSDGAGNAVYNSNVTIPGTLTCNSTTNVTANLQLASASGSSGNFIKKTGATTQAWSDLAASDIKGGTANQFLQSNGTNATFVTDVTFPGNFAMTSPTAVASVLELRCYGALKLGGNNAGVLGAVCVSDGSSVPHWEYPQYFARYYDNTVRDMNGAASVTMFSTASADVTNSNISYSAGTFTVTPAGNYKVTVRMRATTVGAGAQTQTSIKINGAFASSQLSTIVAGSQSIQLSDSYKLNAGSTIQVVTQPIVAGTINTNGNDSNGVATCVITIERMGAYV